jgi:tRNA(Ile)-lysidine synthase
MLVHSVFKTLRRFALVRPGDRVLVALSGGPDSVALAQALWELRSELGLDLTLAHLNHQLREGADQDEAFCAGLAERFGLPFVSGRVDVRAEARLEGGSIEETARAARYRFLEDRAEALGCQRIAVGHTRDDQAETFLLRLLRGAGGSGLAAIPPIRPARVGRVIRPLLAVRRVEVLAFLEKRDLPYREDPTNADLAIPRNRIRLQTLPELERQFNPRLVDALAQTADILREEDDWLEQQAAEWLESHARSGRGELRLSAERLSQLHPALGRRVLRAAIRRVKGDLRSLAARHLEAVGELLEAGKSGRRLALPGGIEATRSFDDLRLRQRNRREANPDYRLPLPVPGEVVVPEASGVLRVELSQGSALPAAAGDAVVIRLANDAGPLAIRSPRAGDRFHPLGAPGSKKLSRYLMERRVDQSLRRRVPLVVAGEGDRILWVVGHSVSETASAKSASGRLLRLEWRSVAGATADAALAPPQGRLR